MPPLSSRRGRFSQRQSSTQAASSPRTSVVQLSTLPPYEAPIAPLNTKAQIALSGLLSGPVVSRLQKQITEAAGLLHAVASDLNDYGAECREVHVKKKAKRGNEENAEADAEHEAREKNIESLTVKLEHAVRKTVDEEVFVGTLPEMMQSVAEHAAEGNTGQTQSSFPTQTQRSRNQRGNGTMADGEDEEEPPPANPPSDAPPSPSHAPSALLASAVETHTGEWSSKSLYNRYASHNTYIAFKQSVHDAQHSSEENAPPLPNRKTWFGTEDRQAAGPTDTSKAPPSKSGRAVAHTSEEIQDAVSESETSDLEIAAEKISTKCPITFLPFQYPLTSTKCPHSFESEAILSMLSRSSDTQPIKGASQSQSQSQNQSSQARRGRNRRLVKVVRCPICSTPLAKDDLRPDPVLARKVRRLEARETQRQEGGSEDEEGEEDEDELSGTQKRKGKGKSVVLGSSPPKSIGTVKREVSSGRSGVAVRSTPSMTAEGTVMDLDGPEDDEEEEDEIVDEIKGGEDWDEEAHMMSERSSSVE